MTARPESSPTERVCIAGCNPDPQPIASFYSRGLTVAGFRSYDRRCKRCQCDKGMKRYAAQKRGDFVPDDRQMRPLPTRDLIACEECGLRGHAACDRDEDGPRCPKAKRFDDMRLGARGEDWLL